jgi:dTDP-4-amino-4,6-dideoxygalactose transaminase
MPLLGAEEAEAVARVLETGYLTQGPKAAEFERGISAITGSAYAFATSSATTGLHLALAGLGIEPGDEVVVPDLSFPATANVVVQQGATPVFVDVRLDDFGVDPEKLEAAITPRTRAIMPVHAFGLVADMDPISTIAERHGIPVIEDAACALGATYRGRPAGSIGSAGVFSFHPRKVITTGEGGMLVTSDARLAERVAVLRSHGSVRGSHFMSFVDAGYNYRLSDVHAAIGVAQLARLEGILRSRRDMAGRLSNRLQAIEGVRVPVTPPDRTHTFQSYVVLLEATVDRDAVIDAMRERGIETTLGTYAMHLQPYFRARYGVPDEELPGATRIHHSGLTLPLYPQLTDDDLDQIARALGESVALARRPS